MSYRIFVIIATSIAAIVGVVTYAWFNHRLIITYKPHHTHYTTGKPIATQTAHIRYILHNTWHSEERTIISCNNTEEHALRITQEWLAVMQEHDAVVQPCHVQSTVSSSTGHIVYISFDHIPFSKQSSLYSKWITVESLLETLRINGVQNQSVHLFVDHQPIQDDHLDFTYPWPSEGFTATPEYSAETPNRRAKHATDTTIMLIPAGDGTSAGRLVDNQFERGITLALCQAIQRNLHNHNIHAIITRAPGEQTQLLYSAGYANRMQADMCISVHAYQAAMTPESNIYYLAYHPEIDFWHHPNEPLNFTPHDRAHTPHIHHAVYIGQLMTNIIFQRLGEYMHVGSVTGLPCKPLLGIQTPAIAIELGLVQAHDWHAYADTISQSVYQTIATYQLSS